MTRIGAFVRGATSLVVLVALVAGPPFALICFGRWPTSSAAATNGWWEQLSNTVISDTAIVVVLTLAVTVIWALFVFSVVVELVAAFRSRPARRVVLAGPLQRGARGLVVAVFVAFSAPAVLSGPAPATATTPAATAGPTTTRPAAARRSATPAAAAVPVASPATTPTAIAVAGSPNGAAVTQRVTPVAPAPAAAAVSQPAVVADVVTVTPGDSAWELAATHLGDGMRWRELWDLNRGVPQTDGRAWTDPQLLRPAWQLRLPPATLPGAASTLGGSDASVVHVVEPGETLSGIAAHYLGDAHRYPELFTANHGHPQPDGGQLTDADVIRPGWRLVIPPATASVGAPPAVAVPTTTADEPSSPLPPTTMPDAPPATVPQPLSAPSPRSVPTSSVPAAVPQPTASNQNGGGSVPSTVMVGIAGAVVLASGFAVRMLRLRRRRGVRGARHAGLRASPVEAAVIAAGDVPLVRWAGQCLAEMVRDIDRRQLSAAPVAVELSERTGIEVLWDDVQDAAAPSGWSVADGGWAWRHRFDPEAPVPVAALPASIPALVTIGQRDGRQLLVDLEAFGLVTVSGPADRVDGLLRAISVELAAGDELSDAYVYAVGVDTGLAGAGLERLDHAELDATIDTLDGVRRSVRDALDVGGVSDTFCARVGAAEPIDVTVMVAHRVDRYARRLLETAPERGGVAVVAGVDVPDLAEDAAGGLGIGRAHVSLDPDGTGHLAPLGVTFHASWLPLATTTEAGVALCALTDLDTIDDLTASSVTSNGRPEVEERDARIDAEPAATTMCSEGAEVPDVAWLPDPADVDASSNGHHDTDDTSLASIRDISAVASPDELLDGRSVDDASGLVVRVLGVPAVPSRDLGRRELILAVLLACRGGAVTASAAQDAVWGGRPVEAKTVWNVVASTRRALGTFADGSPVMPSVDRVKALLRLDARVCTDLASLRSRLDAAHGASSGEAIVLLHEGLALVEGPPFDGAGFDWAHRDQDVAEACTVISHVVETLVELALDAGQIDTARDAVTRGLRGLPGDEALYRLRMRIEHHAGRHGGIVAAYDELTVYLNDLDTEPSAVTTALYRELTRNSTR